jgi:hypothetical protein
MSLSSRALQARNVTTPPSVGRLSRQRGILNFSQPYRAPRPVTGIALLYFGLTSNKPSGQWAISTAAYTPSRSYSGEPQIQSVLRFFNCYKRRTFELIMSVISFSRKSVLHGHRPHYSSVLYLWIHIISKSTNTVHISILGIGISNAAAIRYVLPYSTPAARKK